MKRSQMMIMLLLGVDKGGVAKFATLVKKGWVIIADEKSAEHLQKLGVEYISVEQVAGGNDTFCLNLLDPRIMAGILSLRSDAVQMKSNLLRKIEKIDMVVASIPMRGNPDIEGFNTTAHALVARSAQNTQGLTLVVDSGDHDVIVEMIQKEGDTTPEMKKELVAKAYTHLASHFASLGRIINHQLKGHPKLLPV
jgi:AICAR transformylase/IMP cyclohydrolase PurH